MIENLNLDEIVTETNAMKDKQSEISGSAKNYLFPNYSNRGILYIDYRDNIAP